MAGRKRKNDGETGEESDLKKHKHSKSKAKKNKLENNDSLAGGGGEGTLFHRLLAHMTVDELARKMCDNSLQGLEYTDLKTGEMRKVPSGLDRIKWEATKQSIKNQGREVDGIRRMAAEALTPQMFGGDAGVRRELAKYEVDKVGTICMRVLSTVLVGQ